MGRRGAEYDEEERCPREHMVRLHNRQLLHAARLGNISDEFNSLINMKL